LQRYFPYLAISGFWSASSASDGRSKMQKDELIIQLLKIGLGLLFAAYFFMAELRGSF
jgi:hypothetical protein